MQFFIACLPILSVFVFLILLRLPAIKAMPISLAIALACVGIFWKMPSNAIYASMIEGIVLAGTILIILFGAMLVLNTLKHVGALKSIEIKFNHLTQDQRIQTLIVTYGFGSLMEGIAGFGTPAALCAGLLLALGFKPIQAVVLALVADCAAVSFGAVGTPLLLGVGSSLEQFDTMQLNQLASSILMIEFMTGILTSLSLMALIIFVFGKQSITAKLAWNQMFSMVPLCIIANTTFIGVAYLSIQVFNTVEFSSIFGALAMLLVLFVLSYKKWLTPKTVFRLTEFEEKDQTLPLSLTRAATPYALIILLLLISRLEVLPFKRWLIDFKFSLVHIFDTSISVSVSPLYLPGFFFALALFLSLPALKLSIRQYSIEASNTIKQLTLTSITLICAIVLVRLFLNSSINLNQSASMPIVIANSMTSWFPDTWVFFSPFIGALGSFISGSATFSNMMFSQLQFAGAEQLSLDPNKMMILQVIGANAGNMICVVNVVAAASVVGCQGQEGQIIKLTIIPMMIYCLSAASFVLLFFL
ncbi:L-lactate permease [Marinicellulosiphila megalodicopiae]|uniref:L-lactate permease n=1 Tax=Marinicellulosiphila megalodicopiae TaxID=2724896 RepID=UPI003BB12E64